VPAAACWLPGPEGAAERLGVTRYLVKPVTRGALLDTLAELCPDATSVLVVDDNAEALQLFSRMLGGPERRFRVWQARNGSQALAGLRERRPDVLVLDLVMPGVDGFAVLREKERDPALRGIPVVVVSSLDPAGEPIVSEALTVTRKGGLSGCRPAS
jgi:CheY-like chemotaxis protein